MVKWKEEKCSLNLYYLSEYFEALKNIISNVETTSVSLSDVMKDLDGVLNGYGCTRDMRAYLLANIVEINSKITWIGKPTLDVLIKNYIPLAQFPSPLLETRCVKPTLFVKSENSSYMPYSVFDKLGKIFTKAKFEVVKEADHFPQCDSRPIPSNFLNIPEYAVWFIQFPHWLYNAVDNFIGTQELSTPPTIEKTETISDEQPTTSEASTTTEEPYTLPPLVSADKYIGVLHKLHHPLGSKPGPLQIVRY
ncbi:unnamed protein product [Orchesella dallaii]|uniref:Uncharacterized protein n=1 Tax=Orchesella dallaii TaxID=48710 RepID=A0ABP1RK07_9HEXA